MKKNFPIQLFISESHLTYLSFEFFEKSLLEKFTPIKRNEIIAPNLNICKSHVPEKREISDTEITLILKRNNMLSVVSL